MQGNLVLKMNYNKLKHKFFLNALNLVLVGKMVLLLQDLYFNCYQWCFRTTRYSTVYMLTSTG